MRVCPVIACIREYFVATVPCMHACIQRASVCWKSRRIKATLTNSRYSLRWMVVRQVESIITFNRLQQRWVSFFFFFSFRFQNSPKFSVTLFLNDFVACWTFTLDILLFIQMQMRFFFKLVNLSIGKK